mmetsp:Transcript_96107/g.152013  ORF Transcript_96107/g.152013 Transcript_96107/m.152013 type:complete len:238 (+) Transcript_96107:224-937(+)
MRRFLSPQEVIKVCVQEVVLVTNILFHEKLPNFLGEVIGENAMTFLQICCAYKNIGLWSVRCCKLVRRLSPRNAISCPSILLARLRLFSNKRFTFVCSVKYQRLIFFQLIYAFLHQAPLQFFSIHARGLIYDSREVDTNFCVCLQSHTHCVLNFEFRFFSVEFHLHAIDAAISVYIFLLLLCFATYQFTLSENDFTARTTPQNELPRKGRMTIGPRDLDRRQSENFWKYGTITYKAI